MARLPLLPIGLALALLAAGCSGPGKKSDARPASGSDTATAEVPAYRLICGEGGGFTGRYGGFIVEADGKVVTWQGIDVSSAPTTPIGTVSAADRGQLWRALIDAGFFARELNEPGNLNRFVRVEAPADTQMWNWSFDPGADSTSRVAVWNACQEIFRRVD
ncbi:MAG TPA: hypothetical protein VF720_04740 [Candidatus Eisenbacteria bacterium]